MTIPEFDELPPLVGNAWLVDDGTTAVQMLRAAQSSTAEPVSTARFSPGDFIVGAHHLGGDDDSLRVTVAGLRSIGVAGLIAQSFAPRFFQELLTRGLPALVIEEAAAIAQGDRLRIDIERHKIANRSSGDRYIIRNFYDDESLDILRAGGLAAYRARRAALSGGANS